MEHEYTYKYKCFDNDNIIRVVVVDGEVDEIQVGDVLDTSRIIIGYGDLEAAVKNALAEKVD